MDFGNIFLQGKNNTKLFFGTHENMQIRTYLFTILQTLSSISNGLVSDKEKFLGPYKAYSILPTTQDHLEVLRLFHDLHQELIWKDNIILGEATDVIAPYEDQSKLEQILTQYNIQYKVTVNNVERLILEESEQNDFLRNRLLDDSGPNGQKSFYDISRYHSYDDMVRYMNFLKWRYYYMVDLIDLGKTYEGRTIKTIKISYPIEAKNKRSIWIDAGTHAREWASHSTAMYFINLLTTQYDYDPEVRQYVNNFTWYITPVLNPDGYEYSRSVKSVRVRMWRKNRSKREAHCSPSTKRCCVGVDLNRNFDFYWHCKLHCSERFVNLPIFFCQAFSNNRQPCFEDYRGPWAFSENETMAVRDFMYKHGHEIDAYITMHTYSQYWIYPFGHKASVYPKDIDELKAVALNATEALRRVHGTVYKIGSGADLLSTFRNI
uniref:Peptidase M14 carboxypeptidase A domain-containing protein n=1 Tax=Romanomermis culicivorax TaxID=13658 RepID=A0A915HSG3_ROMCU